MSAPAYRLDLDFVRHTWRLARPYWKSDEKRSAGWHLFLLLVLLLAYTWFSVKFNSQSGEITSALAAKDGDRFWHAIALFFGLLVVGVPIDAWYYFVRDKLALNWRRWLTGRLLGKYLTGRAYYRLTGHPEIDNPDQRVADDVYSFTQQSLGFVLVFANALLQVVAFGQVLWTISLVLVLFLALYAAIITALTMGVFGQRLVRLNYLQRQREGDFRFGLVRVRENAEAIAFYHGEHEEKRRLDRVFGRLYDNAARVIRWSLGLNCVYYGNGYLALVLPTMIVAPRVLSGELEVGRIVEATGAFAAVMGALTILVDNMEGLSRFAASVGRLESFITAMKESKTDKSKRIGAAESETLRFDHVTLRTPDGDRVVVENLSLTVEPGEHLLIAGPSGVGKSSLLRAVAGLWNHGEGTLARPAADELLFLPQHPYLVPGSLRTQLSYPRLGRDVSDEEFLAVLQRVRLAHLPSQCGGLDGMADLERMLSVGERQRLAIAKVFLNQPRYALLDEATSALDPENEELVYEALAQLPGTTLVSISHHAGLVKFHRQVLELRGGGDWETHPSGGFELGRPRRAAA